MKAQIKPRINTNDRTKLQDVIPLSTPITLFIDPCNICNLKCTWCPSGHPELIKDTNRKQTTMDFDLYKKIINDITQFDKPINTIHFYKEGEPLLNKHFPEMIKYAKDTIPKTYIDTTTNGFLLTQNLSKEILESGIDRVNISINGLSKEQYLKYTNTEVNFRKYLLDIINLYKLKEEINPNCEICIKIIGDFLTEHEKNIFFNLFGNCCDRIFIENLAPCWSEFNVQQYSNTNINSKKGIYNNKITNVDTCPYIFYSTTINSDGTVSLCFLDWKHELVIGNINNQSLYDIWNNNVILFQYQIQNLTGKRKEISQCKDCGQLTHCLPDDIDPYTKSLTEKLLAKRKIR